MNKKMLAAGAAYLLVELVAAGAGLFVGMAAATGFELEPLAVESGVIIFGTAVLFMHGMSRLVFGPHRPETPESAGGVIAPGEWQWAATAPLSDDERKLMETIVNNRNRLGK